LPFAVIHVGLPFSFISISVLEEICALSLFQVFPELTDVFLTVFVSLFSLAVSLVFLIETRVFGAVIILVDTKSIFDAVLELSIVGSIYFGGVESFTVIHVVLHLSKVEIAITEVNSDFVSDAENREWFLSTLVFISVVWHFIFIFNFIFVFVLVSSSPSFVIFVVSVFGYGFGFVCFTSL
jgi:hypothetical protein